MQVTHRGLVSYLAGVAGRAGLGEPGGRYALLQSAGDRLRQHDARSPAWSAGGVLHVLAAGAAVSAAGRWRDTWPGTGATSSRWCRRTWRRWQKQRGWQKTGGWQKAEGLAGRGLARLAPRRVLVLGGEALPAGLAAGLAEAAAGRTVVNHYGPTETTIGVTTIRLEPADLTGPDVPIGPPVPNTRLYVLDRT